MRANTGRVLVRRANGQSPACSRSPRWALATDPYVRVNGGTPKRLTKVPVEFEVPSGNVSVEVALFRSGHFKPEGRQLNPITRRVAHLANDDDVLRLWFHPAHLRSYMREGHIGQE